VDVNKAWESTGENIKISAKESLGYYELKKNKPRFDEGCSFQTKVTYFVACLNHKSERKYEEAAR
jgi:hypothetical protein